MQAVLLTDVIAHADGLLLLLSNINCWSGGVDVNLVTMKQGAGVETSANYLPRLLISLVCHIG